VFLNLLSVLPTDRTVHFLATGGLWLKKYTEIYTVRPPWLKIILKSDILFSDRPPWLKSVFKCDILLATDRRG
jgi:hypothetical protein